MQEVKELKDTEEIWKDIKGYEGMYQVSSEGRIKSLDRVITDKNDHKRHIHGKIIKTRWRSKNNYLKVDLCKNGHYKEHYVHQLVANAFIPNPDYDFHVRHKNKNKRDNRVENLYRLSWNRPVGIFANVELIKVYSSVTEAAQQNNVSPEDIRYMIGCRSQFVEYIEDYDK